MSEETTADKNYRLQDPEIDRLKKYGEVRSHQEGDILFAPGDQEIDFLVILSGQLDVVLEENGDEVRVGWLEPKQFTGDVGLITRQRSRFLGRMAIEGEVLHVSPEQLRQLLVADTELSDILVSTFIARRAWQRAENKASAVLVGHSLDRDAFTIRDLLSRHSIPHLWIEIENEDQATPVLDRIGLTVDDAPILILGANVYLKKPTIAEVSETLGLNLLPESACADVVVVGAGPAGLASSVYAASEGLSVVTIDGMAPGGQAGTSSKIENYLGFPSGISGRDLADRASVQAQKFGARIAAPVTADELVTEDDAYVLKLKDGRQLNARAVIIATGADYRRLPIDNLEDYEGRGVYYGATAMEAQICQGSRVAIVGAGNSAGQGAVFLSKSAQDVHVFYRRANIRDTMSEYLVTRLEQTPNIHLHPESEITGIDGCENRIRSLRMSSPDGPATLDANFLFLFIGAAPCSDWLPSSVARDEKGFIKTGPTIANLDLVRASWSLDRMPTLFETSLPRVYAVGDVRSGSVKRVASGVGEGSIVIQFVHQAISEASRAKAADQSQ
ncbi:MAG: FAD-dependent oxidoreductase [Pseudomonadota bacterium]